MKYFQVDGWRFEVDQILTHEFYKKRPTNFNPKKHSKSLDCFFEMFGLDLSKPYEIYGDGAECIFPVFGKAFSETGFEIEILDNNTHIYIIVYPNDNCGISGLGPVFSIGIPEYKRVL